MVGAWVVKERGRLPLTLVRGDACAERTVVFGVLLRNVHSYDRQLRNARLSAPLLSLARLATTLDFHLRTSFASESRTRASADTCHAPR